MSTPLTPAHVLGLAHSTTDQSIDSTFDGAGRDSFAGISHLVADDPDALFCRYTSRCTAGRTPGDHGSAAQGANGSVFLRNKARIGHRGLQLTNPLETDFS